MKIGMIIYSQTGNTESVANKLRDRLIKKGPKVSVEKIIVNRDMKNPNKPIEFIKTPKLEGYDTIIFGSPVEAFSLCPVMLKYLENIEPLDNKNIFCYVTQYFPYPWMGGNHAIKQMKELCLKKGGNISDTGVINWKNKKRDDIIEEVIDNFCKSL